MKIRKVLKFGNILGITLPREYTEVLGIKHGSQIEVSLANQLVIAIKKHKGTINQLRETDIPKSLYE